MNGSYENHSLDIDNASRKHFEGIKKLFKFMFPHALMYTNKSASGKGFHIKIMGLNMNWNESMNFRKLFDDPKRQAYDIRRRKIGVNTQVMFTQKKGKRISEEDES